MHIYGADRDVKIACPSCKAGVGVYCACDANGPLVCERRARAALKHSAQTGAAFVVTVSHCSRCRGYHPDLDVKPLTHAAGEYTHWATCPTNGEPILIRVEK